MAPHKDESFSGVVPKEKKIKIKEVKKNKDGGFPFFFVALNSCFVTINSNATFSWVGQDF